MPLIKREVVPVFLSRQLNTQGAEYELESVTNKTLSNVVLQLSSLSKHAEDIFGELYNEADSICKRSCGLQERIDKLSNKVTKLDATKDDVSLLEYMETKPFSSKIELESTPLNKKPANLEEAYNKCQLPPPLNKLSPFREDGKEALKFYTDPKYFFELWSQEMQKNIQDIRQKRKKRRQRVVNPTSSTVTAPRNVRDQYSHLKMGVDLQPVKNKSMTGIGNTPQAQHHRPEIVHTVNADEPVKSNARQSYHDRNSVRPGSKPPAPPGPAGPAHDGYPNGDLRPGRPAPQPPVNNNPDFINQVPPPIMDHGDQPKIMTHDDYVQQMNSIVPPPPPIEPAYPVPPPAPSPPPMDANFQPLPPPPPPPPPPGPGISAVPPPPPPPPPPGMGVAPKPPPIQTGTVPAEDNDLPIHSPPPLSPVSKPIQADPRSELLKAIERGINLKKTDMAKEKAFQKEKPDNSVEAILSRRIAVELSDSDTDMYDSDEDNWSDEED